MVTLAESGVRGHERAGCQRAAGVSLRGIAAQA